MAAIQGTNIVAPVVPLDTTDVYPTHEAQYGKGGYRVVSSTAQRDAIPAARREEGMLVFVTADSQRYRLGSDLVTWSTDSSGGGGASSWNDLTGKPSTFPPSTHAASHGAAGSDPVTVTVGQVTGLQTALDGKALATSPTLIAGVTVIPVGVPESPNEYRLLVGTNGVDETSSVRADGTITCNRLSASSRVTLPSGASGSATARDIYAVANTLRYRDSTNTERLLLNATDNLANLANAATARTNLGLGGAATLSVGTTAGTLAAGDDSRFTDARTPLSHAHGNISNVGTLASGVMGAGSVGGPVVFDVLAGAVARGEFGTSAGQVCQGNDSRLSDARTPTGAAGGDLTGTYPNPQIAAGAVVTADLANSAVTYAKVQNVSATDRILGRSTAGAGVVEEITCTAFGRSIIDDADATAARTTLGLATVASSGSAADLTGTLADARLSTNARQSVEQFIHPFLLAGM